VPSAESLEPKPPRQCVFCGGRPLTLEHVMPQWLTAFMGISSSITLTSDGRLVRRSPKLDIKVRAVCRPCNNGWLSALEDEFRARCGPAILGMRTALDQQAQTVAATWAVKTALLLELALRYSDKKKAYAPPSHFHYLFRNRTAPPNGDARVWVGFYDAQQTHIGWHRAFALAPSGKDPAQAYIATVAVGYLVFQTFGRDILPSDLGSGDLPDPEIPAVLVPYFRQVWPIIAPSVQWPPRFGFPFDSLDSIFNFG
jgi:hypothetical protein